MRDSYRKIVRLAKISELETCIQTLIEGSQRQGLDKALDAEPLQKGDWVTVRKHSCTEKQHVCSNNQHLFQDGNSSCLRPLISQMYTDS